MGGRQPTSSPGPSRRQTQAAEAAPQSARKSDVLKRHTSSIVGSIADAIVIKDGEPFFLCPPDGQIPTRADHGFGLYHHDTRFLAGYELTVAGARPNALAATAVTGRRALLELTMPAVELGDGRSIAKERLALRWERELSGDNARLRDRITLRNYDADGAELTLGFRFAADFDDVFVIRGLLAERRGTVREPAWHGSNLELGYDGADGIVRYLTVAFDRQPDRTGGPDCDVRVRIDGRSTAMLELTFDIREDVQPGAIPIERRAVGSAERPRDTSRPHSRSRDTDVSGGDGWGVQVRTDGIVFNAALARSLADLATLRDDLGGRAYYSAGVPWFATLFGRDSLITAYQTLAFDAGVAADTLRLLASRQGAKRDDWRDEQPGKILHELRIGELARLNEIPQTPYYGTIDATPLFLILLGHQARWTGRLDLFRDLRSNVDRALDWIDRTIEASEGGYLAYDSTTDRGLVNQGWKDSGDAIVTAGGRLAEPPIALAEVQGYVHAAWLEVAALLERSGEVDAAGGLRRKADDLRRRFEADFWSDDLGTYALALERGRGQCQVVSSNAGQVLWSGIAAADRARATADRLLRDDAFSGWGIRTLSTDARAFNPIGYHLGTVWPHDNALIAEGFRRYGLDDAAERIAIALVEASTDFPQQRLPECFAGLSREEFGVPVRYPVACHPQAWAAGALPHLLASTLGLQPDAFDHRLRIVRPRLPRSLQHLELNGLRVGDATVDLSVQRSGSGTTVEVVHREGHLDVETADTTATGRKDGAG